MGDGLGNIPAEAERCKLGEVTVMLALIKLQMNDILVILLHFDYYTSTNQPTNQPFK
jgi:hypothetical protein